MSDLESRIRNLSLRLPGEAMDQRVLSVLQTHPTASDIRRGVATTVVWLVAVASLIFGIAIGRALPTSEDRAEVSAGDTKYSAPGPEKADRSREFRNALESRPPVQETDVRGQDTPGSLFASSEETRRGSGQESQITDSVSMSLRDAVLMWERQTGQIFNVATHVRDPRFNMCRECHRIGG